MVFSADFVFNSHRSFHSCQQNEENEKNRIFFHKMQKEARLPVKRITPLPVFCLFLFCRLHPAASLRLLCLMSGKMRITFCITVIIPGLSTCLLRMIPVFGRDEDFLIAEILLVQEEHMVLRFIKLKEPFFPGMILRQKLLRRKPMYHISPTDSFH